MKQCFTKARLWNCTKTPKKKSADDRAYRTNNLLLCFFFLDFIPLSLYEYSVLKTSELFLTTHLGDFVPTHRKPGGSTPSSFGFKGAKFNKNIPDTLYIRDFRKVTL